MSRFSLLSSMAIALAGALSSCSSESDLLPESEKTSTTFHIGLNTLSRAAQSLNLANYDAKMYLYEGHDNGDGTVGYSQVRELELTDNHLTVEDLKTKTSYKAVFLAVPKGQTPKLPDLYSADIVPSYKEATAGYINGNDDETDKHIFRSILSFVASANTGTQSTVLTRQNGALEVRIKNIPDMQSVKLQVKGHTTMYIHDGTGGQVITDGEPIALSKTITDGLGASEVRVKINLLPQENIADAAGTNNYLEITTSTGTTKYPIKSDHPTIPIYPNQITWLTLGNGSGNFDVSFSGNINIEDEEWDGWIDNF